MNKRSHYSTEVVVIGGGLAGIAACLELLDSGRKVILLDRDILQNLGGLAKLSFGGMFFVDSPYQRMTGIKDSPELALADWTATAEFGKEDRIPKEWANLYVNQCKDEVYRWIHKRGVRFFPVVHWVERGLYLPGNSVPRFHMVWGTGKGLIDALVLRLLNHKNKENLQMLFRHRVESLAKKGNRITGCVGKNELDRSDFQIEAEHTVIASGGVAGDLADVRKNWYQPWGPPPKTLLNGSHKYAIGDLHKASKKVQAKITHMDLLWNYAAGVHHPRPHHPNHGLSLVPPRSALWLNYQGRRIGPEPLITGYDTRHLVEKVCEQKEKYSWQVLNRKIALKELAVSGSEYNDSIRDKKLFSFLKDILLGNSHLVDDLTEHCEDFLVADTIHELAQKMNDSTKSSHIDPELLEKEIRTYDDRIQRGASLQNDEQLRRLVHLRQYRGDRVRNCKNQTILDPKAGPLIAIREFVLTRKTLGGIVTDTKCRVLRSNGTPIPGLYAVGESAGFGGGGIHGKRSLEGTFLGCCILTGRISGQTICNS